MTRRRRTPLHALAWLAALACLQSVIVQAGEDEAPPALTALEAGPYRAADAVLVGRVVHVTDVRAPGGNLGRQIARVQVERVFKGRVRPGDAITATVVGQRPTLDPGRPSIPYFRAGREERFVLFLERSSTGATWRLKTLYDAQDAVGEEKIAAVAGVSEVAAMSDPGARARRMVALLLAGLKAPGRWTKAHAARELAYLARAAPGAIDAATEARIRRLPPSALTPDQRHWLRILFELLAQRERPASEAQSPANGEADAWRATFKAATSPEDRKTLLARLVEAGGTESAGRAWWAWPLLEPSLRIWFARLVAERGATDAASLRGVYAGEEEPEVRAALVRGVGLLGGREDVAWLAARLENVALRRPVLLALARIRTKQARAWLEDARLAASAQGESDLVTWIEYLGSPAFEESERRAGRPVGPR